MNKSFLNALSIVLMASLLSIGAAPVLVGNAQTEQIGVPQNEEQSAEGVEPIVSFDRDDYAVSVFEDGTQLRMNVYDKKGQRFLIDGGDTIRQEIDGKTVYVHRGRVAAQVHVAADGSERLSFGEGLIQRDLEAHSTVDESLYGSRSSDGVNTLVLFERDGYAVRIFEDSEQLKMNIYNQQRQMLLVDAGSVVRQSVGDETAYVHRGEIEAQVHVAADGSERLSFGEGLLNKDSSEVPVR